METLWIISAYVMPIVMLALVWLITSHFAWAVLAAVVFFALIKILQKKLGYGKTVAFEILVVVIIFAGDQVRVEYLNDSRKKEAVRQEEAAIKKELAEKEARQAEKENLRQKKRELVKDFALKESPTAWEIFLSIESECSVAKKKVAELKKTLESFDKKPDDDADFIAAKSKLAEMTATCETLWKSMERAYIQYCKFKASSGDAALAELSSNMTAEAVKEATAAKERYRLLTQGQ